MNTPYKRSLLFGMEIWATNATKHGDRQLMLRKSL